MILEVIKLNELINKIDFSNNYELLLKMCEIKMFLGKISLEYKNDKFS